MPLLARTPPTNDFATRLDEALDAKGMSLNQLAQKTHTASGQISRLRTRGCQQIAPDFMFAIADALGVEARWLFTGDGPTTTNASRSSDREDANTVRLRERIASLETALEVVERTARASLRR